MISAYINDNNNHTLNDTINETINDTINGFRQQNRIV